MIDFSALTGLNDLQEELEISCMLDEGFSPSGVVISLRGVLDQSNTIEFAEAVMDFFNGNWKEHPLFLDLSELQYISSSGIGSFTTVRVQSEHKGSPLYLVDMNVRVRSVFDQLGFSSFFNIIDSIEDVRT